MLMVGMMELLLAFFIAIDSSEVYPPELRGTFVENSLAGETFTQELPANTVAVFMTGNFGVCKSKKGIRIPLSEAVSLAREIVSKRRAASQDIVADPLKRLDTIHDSYKSVLRMFHGELGVALLNFQIGRRPPDFIVRADIDESEMTFMDLVKKIAGALPRDASGFLPRQEEEYLNFADRVYVRIKNKKLYAANSPLVIEQFLSGAWKDNPLSNLALYVDAGRKVEFDQEQFLFINVERIRDEVMPAHDPAGAEPPRGFALLALDNTRAIATSTRLSKGSLNILSAVVFKDLTKGIPKILARPNARSEAATFVPPDYSVLTRGNTGSPVGLLRDVMALHEDVARGIRKALGEMERELGFSVERDLLPALSGDFALTAKMPPMIGIPESLAIVRIGHHDKAALVIESIVKRTKLAGFDEEYKGAKLRVVPLPLVSLTYVFVEGHLLVGSSPEVVKAAIDAHLSGKNLAASDGYKSAFGGHPSESFAAIYADAQAIFNGLLNIGGGLAMSKGGGEARQFIVPMIALLRRNVKDLAPISCSIYREGNAIILKTNSRLFAAGPVPVVLPALVFVHWVEVRPAAPIEEEEMIEESVTTRR